MRLLRQRTVVPFVCLFLFVGGFFLSNRAILQRQGGPDVNYALGISGLSPTSIKFLAGEFEGLFADFILLQIGAFLGSNQSISEEQWERIALGFEQVLTLDPYFQQAYLQAQGCLTWEGGMPRTTIALLDIVRANRTWDWRPGYYMAFDYYYFLEDYENASKIFLETGQMEGAPILLTMLGSRFAIKEQRAEASLRGLVSILEDPATELSDNDKKELTHRIEALKGVITLERALAGYHKDHGDYPVALENLVTAGYIPAIPDNPYGDYEYDADEGAVYFDAVGRKKK